MICELSSSLELRQVEQGQAGSHLPAPCHKVQEREPRRSQGVPPPSVPERLRASLPYRLEVSFLPPEAPRGIQPPLDSALQPSVWLPSLVPAHRLWTKVQLPFLSIFFSINYRVDIFSLVHLPLDRVGRDAVGNPELSLL